MTRQRRPGAPGFFEAWARDVVLLGAVGLGTFWLVEWLGPDLAGIFFALAAALWSYIQNRRRSVSRPTTVRESVDLIASPARTPPSSTLGEPPASGGTWVLVRAEWLIWVPDETPDDEAGSTT